MEGREVNDVTARNILKVTRYRDGGEGELKKMAGRFEREVRRGEKGGEGGGG